MLRKPLSLHLVSVSFIAVMIGVFCASVLAVDTYQLRSQIAPPCTSSQGSSLKYADIFAEGNIAVQGSYGCKGAFIYDITNPDAPVLANWYNPGASRQFLEAVILNGRGYFGAGNNPTGGGGVHIVDLTNPYAPVPLGIVNSTNGNGHNTIHEMVVIEQDGYTYLIENSNSISNKTIKIIDVTNPAAPVFVRDLIPTEPQWVHAMMVKGSRLFTSGWGNSSNRARTEIYDITDLATSAPVLLGYVTDLTSVTAGNRMHSAWPSEDGNYLYSARELDNSALTNPGDIRVYDISNPAVPLLIRKISSVSLGLNASTPHNPVVMGNKLYVSWYQAGLQVFDLTVPGDPVRVGEYDTYLPVLTEEERAQAARERAKYDPSDIVCGRVMSLDLAVTGYNGAWAVYPFLGEDKVLVGDLATGLYVIDITPAGTPTPTPTSTATPTPAPTPGSIAGTVSYGIVSKPVPNVILTAASESGGGSLEPSAATDSAGSYLLTGFGGDGYTVSPAKAPQQCGVINGIFSLDAAKVSQAVVGLTTFTPMQRQAAMVGRLGYLSSFDASLIARRAVGLCSDNLSGQWVFTPSHRSYQSVNSAIVGENYTAIMMGDVDGDWLPGGPNRPAAPAPDDRNAVQVSLPSVVSPEGSVIEVPLTFNRMKGVGVNAYQFDIEYDPSVIEPDEAAADLVGTLSSNLSVVYNVLHPGLLKVGVYGAFPASGDGVYANLRFRAIGKPGTTSAVAIRDFRYNEGTDGVIASDGSVKVTAPETVLQGRLVTATGEPVALAAVVLTNTAGERRVVKSTSFGYFEFSSLERGETYTITISSKRAAFTPIMATVTEGVTRLDVIADQ